ncbi:MAG: hypothetical protein KZQ93_01225 [Candidatus Thiodiazotropha sp. (ex Monitilora ramsayi)]|nr:hypothetical protein [Candidatus Thiodiazotropha sp. (ex Monitilora ramsayi)]
MSEAEYTKYMASQCIVREAASLLKDNHTKQGSFPASSEQFSELIALNKERFMCGPYSRIVDNGLSLDSFGEPVQYISGGEFVVVYTTNTPPSIREGQPFALKVTEKVIQETRIGNSK